MRRNLKQIGFPGIMDFLSILYIVLPVCLFFAGWLKVYWAIPLAAGMAYSFWRVHKSMPRDSVENMDKKHILYWMVAILVICFWVYLSGIGGYSFQNADFESRNPAYRDLCDYDWPVVYDLSKQPLIAQEVTGDYGGAAYVYYFAYWLVPAAVSKAVHAAEPVRNFLLYLWTVIGLCLVLYNVNRFLKKNSWIALLLFLFFSGLDAIGFLSPNIVGLPDNAVPQNLMPLIYHLEWWPMWWQYSSNTTQLFWCFNQAIPCWLIMSIAMRMEDGRYSAALFALSLAYSPWAAIWAVPFVIYDAIKYGIKHACNLPNIFVPAAMALVFGSFYLSNGNTGASYGFYFVPSVTGMGVIFSLMIYVMFVFSEAGLYFILMGKNAVNMKYYMIVLVELLLFGLISYRDENFIIRGSCFALFALMLYVARFIEDGMDMYRGASFKTILKTEFTAMIIILCIGSATSFTEIMRSVLVEHYHPGYRNESVYSFGNIQLESGERIKILTDNVFAYDYGDSFFFKTLAK